MLQSIQAYEAHYPIIITAVASMKPHKIHPRNVHKEVKLANA